MKILINAALALGLLLAPAFALAQDAKPLRPFMPPPVKNIIRDIASTTRAEIKDFRGEIKNKIEAKREDVRTRVEEAKQKAKEKFGTAVQRSVGNIVDALTNAIERLTAIADRIDARITEAQSQGKDTATSTALLAGARTDISAAQDKVAAVGAALSTALASTTPKGEMPKVRAAVKAAEEAVRTAKQSLQKTLNSLKTNPQ